MKVVWGEQQRIDITIGDLEQWYYKGIGGIEYSRYLYFKDGLFYK
ncbi:hypothetical protein OB236_21765 [Paenibacillus sp. WQ 127069]|uniref:DUF5348 domain-containing protein n=1 Tax=Paenibacillus baimaensis TaxID=2982185 RepID=A0ABT2UJE8_9BACL|nr:hypothetical protein [Paenibacillus sp. WQ 127069]